MVTNIFIQARMSSSRFPGKVLAPLYNKPVIKHLIDSVREIAGVNQLVVLTSIEESDDPLVAYLKSINCNYYRGSLNNIYQRFKAALELHPCDYFVRLSADSPFLDSRLVTFMIEKIKLNTYDIISNVITRTFPKGQSVEISNAQIFVKVHQSVLTKEDCEHVFPYFYRNQHEYNVLSIENNKNESSHNMCVDTLQDLERLITAPYQFNFCNR